MEFLITTIVAVILLVGVVSSCPNNCSCNTFPYGDVVDCSSNELNSIPTYLSINTAVLKLNNNRISKIEENDFNNLPKLKSLNLNNNDISKIEENAFSNLPTLLALSLINNPISFVSGKAFVNLQQLQQLFSSMDCGDCENIPFWRWLRLDQRTGINITCNDFHGTQLSSLQQNDFTGCSGNDGNGSVWCSRQGDWKWLVYMFFMISLQYIMSNI